MFQIKCSGNTQIKVELLLFNESALNWLTVHLDQGAKHSIMTRFRRYEGRLCKNKETRIVLKIQRQRQIRM